MSLAGPTKSHRAWACSGLMYAGVPTTPTVGVSEPPSPEPELGVSISSSTEGANSSRTNGLARPQSTTNVSSYFPSITFRGFRSR